MRYATLFLLFLAGAPKSSAYDPPQPKFEAIIREGSFNHKTASGVLRAGDSKSIDVNISVEGGVLYNYTFHETSRRNADVNFTRDKHSLRWSGRTRTNNQGESGNFEGNYKAIFVRPIIEFNPGIMNALGDVSRGFSTTDAGRIASGNKSIAGGLSGLMAGIDTTGTSTTTVREINSAVQGWHGDVRLPAGKYIVLPDPNSRWALAGGPSGPHDNDFQGSSNFDATRLHIPLNPGRLAGLAGVLFVPEGGSDQPKDVFQFPPGKSWHTITVPPQGGRLQFIILDQPGTYGDNHGTCKVLVCPTR